MVKDEGTFRKAMRSRLGFLYDRRRKLSDRQKKEIVEKFNSGQKTKAELARLYGVNKSTVYYILSPERREKVKDRIKKTWREYRERHGNEYFNEKVRETQRYKLALYKAGLIGHANNENEKGVAE